MSDQKISSEYVFRIKTCRGTNTMIWRRKLKVLEKKSLEKRHGELNKPPSLSKETQTSIDDYDSVLICCYLCICNTSQTRDHGIPVRRPCGDSADQQTTMNRSRGKSISFLIFLVQAPHFGPY